MQYFKGDDDEIKIAACATPIMDILSGQKDTFFDEAYSCFVLGELLFDSRISPLANAIDRIIFRESFSVIFDAFLVAGTFESYLTVFRNIFGDDVEVEFTVPAAGKLEIEIAAAGVQLYDLVSRTIVSGLYVIDELVEEIGGANIAAGCPKGFQTEYEVNQMLREMVPAGIYTDISLTIG